MIDIDLKMLMSEISGEKEEKMIYIYIYYIYVFVLCLNNLSAILKLRIKIFRVNTSIP